MAFLTGLRADDLKTQDGQVYKDYKITGQDDDGVTILYTDSVKIPYGNLPYDLQKKYGKDPVSLAALLAQAKSQATVATAIDQKLQADLVQQDQELDVDLSARKTKAAVDYSSNAQCAITGQIFLAARGGENIHFGGVRVGLLPLDLFQVWLTTKQKRIATEMAILQPRLSEAKKAEDQALKERKDSLGTDKFSAALKKESQTRTVLDALMTRYNYLTKGEFFTDALLPYYVAQTTTKLNGKFEMKAPAKYDFVLVAMVDSEIGSIDKKYFWFVKIHPTGQPSIYILLDSENLTTSESPDSLIHTKDDPSPDDADN